MPLKKDRKHIAHSKLDDIKVTSAIRGFKYLTLQGTAMEGIADVGVIEKLEKSNVLTQIEEVVGSSASGLIAILVAIGCTPQEIREFVLNLDLKSFQDRSELGWVESTHLPILVQTAIKAGSAVKEKVDAIKNIPLVGDLIKGAIAPYVDPINGIIKYGKVAADTIARAEKAENMLNLALGKDLKLWEGEVLLASLAEIVARKTGNPHITFRELAALANIPGSPYKKLTLTGCKLTEKDGILEHYNVSETPDMPIIQAGRITTSFPGAFKPVVTIEKQGDKERRVVRVAGSLLESLPDIFNQPPYYTPQHNEANPQVLAVAFTKPAKKDLEDKNKPKTKESKADDETNAVQALLRHKYDSNIVFVDTLEIDALGFGMSKAEKEALMEVGTKAVEETFNTILTEEEKEAKTGINYKKISNEELIRIITELNHLDHLEFATEELLEPYYVELEERRLSQEKEKKLRDSAEKSYLRRAKLIDADKMTDKELSEVCARRREELKVLQEQLYQKLTLLEHEKIIFKNYRDAVLNEFKNNAKLRKNLFILRDVSDRYHKAHIKKRENKKPEKSEILKKEYKELKKQRKDLYAKLISKYENIPAIVGFFKTLKQDKNKVEFKVPIDDKSLKGYLSMDIKKYENLIEATKRELNETKEEIYLFKRHEVAFKERTKKSQHFNALLQLKTELDKTIFRKTTLLTKLNSFLMQRAPRLRAIVTPFLKAASFLSFICTFPIGMPIRGIATLIEKYHPDKGARETARNVIDVFQKSDIDLDMKLRGLKEMTTRCINAMQETYVENNGEKIKAIRVLHAMYLKESGIDLKKMFLKKLDETSAAYKARLDTIEDEYLNYEPIALQDTESMNDRLKEIAVELKEITRPFTLYSIGPYRGTAFKNCCQAIMDRLKIEESKVVVERGKDFFRIPAYNIEIRYENNKSINIILSDNVEEIGEKIIEAWNDSELNAPLLNGEMDNIGYMTKKLLKKGITPEFEYEALEHIKKEYGTKENFLSEIKDYLAAKRPK